MMVGFFLRAYAKEHVGLTRAVFELYRGVFSCFVVMQASALSVGQRLFFMCVGHGAHLVGESPTTGICRQV